MIKKEILFLVFMICVKSISQELPNFSPTSPESTEFIKYGNTAVGMYTGKPDVNIPIYTIQGRELSLPISLSYDAGGIKVNQIATQVGLAWSLQAGGFITRITNGKPDHVIGSATGYYGSYYTQYDKLKAFYETSLNEGQQYQPVNPNYFSDLSEYFLFEQNEILQGEIDTQPDYFSVNVGAISGDIYIDPISGKAHCSNGKNYKISYTGSLSSFNGGGITNWHITDEYGNQYFFDLYDTTKTLIDSSGEDNRKTFISSWQLTQIISANGKDVFTFNYDYADFWVNEKFVPTALSQVSTLVNDSPFLSTCEAEITNYNSNTTPYQIAQHYLESITLNGREIISFQQGNVERKDVSSRYPLEKISIANGIDWDLHHSYFKSNPNIDINTANEDDLRLKLDSITISSDIPTSEERTYSFDYFNPEQVPNLQSFSQDYWGFYNGKPNNSPYGLIPAQSVLINNVQQNLPGADRTPNLNSKNGTLFRITYPTGGFTEFDYELHSTYKTEERVVVEDVEIGSLVGGNDLSNPYNYYDDEFFRDTPKGTELFFPVYKTGSKDIRINYASPSLPHAPGDNDDGVLFVAILKCDEPSLPIEPDGCNPPDPFAPDCPTNLEWEDIINYPANNRMLIKTYKGGPDPDALPNGYSETISLNLEAGYYKLYLLNGVTNSRLSVNMQYTQNQHQSMDIPVGGLRVKTTRDFADNNNAPVLIKQYDYTKTILNNCNTPIAVSSSKLHFDPVFSRYSNYTRRTYSNGQALDINECTYINRFSYPLNSIQSPHIAYSLVKETYQDENQENNGHTEYQFYNTVEEKDIQINPPFLKSNFKNGKIAEIQVFDQSGVLKKRTENIYNQTQVVNSIHGFKSVLGRYKQDAELGVFPMVTQGQTFRVTEPGVCGNFVIGFFKCYAYTIPAPTITFGEPYTNKLNTSYLITNNYAHLDETTVVDYFENDSLVTRTNYYYDGLTQFPKTHRQVSRTQTTKSNGDILETQIYYPDDVANTASLGNNSLTTDEFNAIDLLKTIKSDGLPGKNHSAVPIQKETIVKTPANQILSNNIQRTNYRIWTNQTSLPEFIQAAKGENNLENRIVYHKYDNKNNPLEVSKANGVHISYIWGYNQEYPVAKIENATRSEIEALSGFGANFHTGTTGLSTDQENTLRAGLPNAMITTYTYEPLVGVTSITDPREYTMTYHYDEFNRLEFVKDTEGNLVSENKYHYKN